MFLCHLGARRQIKATLRDNGPSQAKFKELFGVDEIPHGDSLNYTFKQLDVKISHHLETDKNEKEI